MSDGSPDHAPRSIGRVKDALRSLFDALGLVIPGRRAVFDDDLNAAIHDILAKGPGPIGLPAALAALPDAAIVLVQNIGREAFREMVNRAADDDTFRAELARLITKQGGSSPSNIIQEAHYELLERAAIEASNLGEKAARTWPTFDSPDKLIPYYRGVCRRLLLRKFKKGRIQRHHEPVAAIEWGLNHEIPPADAALVSEDDEAGMAGMLTSLDDVLMTAPINQRVAYVLKYRNKWKDEKINDILFPENPNRNPDAIRKRIERTIKVEELYLKAKLAYRRKPDQPPTPGRP